MCERINKLTRVSRQLVQELGREPTPDEIAKELGTTPKKVERIIKISQRPLSLEMPVGEEQDSHLGDFIPDESTLGPTDAASHQLLREQMEEILTSLSPREGRVLQLRFGLKDGKSHTLEEVGKKFGVTRSGFAKSKPRHCGNCAIPAGAASCGIIWSKRQAPTLCRGFFLFPGATQNQETGKAPHPKPRRLDSLATHVRIAFVPRNK